MGRVAVRMLFHDRLKLVGSVFGVVLAIVLCNFNITLMSFLVYRQSMLVQNAGAELWIVPYGTKDLNVGRLMPMAPLMEARGDPGVAWAEPLLWSFGEITWPHSAFGNEQMVLVGTRGPTLRGGPWNLVVGTKEALLLPDTMIFEDSYREKLGGLNPGQEVEVNEHRVHVGGFTWGLTPLGRTFAFAEFDLAREILHVPSDRVNYILVHVRPGENVREVQRRIQARTPEVEVLTREELVAKIRHFVIFEAGVGVMLGTSAIIGLIAAFAIVALTMLSAVLDNVREFGTLKAMGATNRDISKVLLIQSLLISALGTVVGMGLLTLIASGHSPNMMLNYDPSVLAGSIGVITTLCVLASGVALTRVRRLEPAMVFR